MPSAQSHLEQSKFNKEAADSIRETSPDWAVTMCFYAALHWVEWYAKNKGKDLETSYPGRPSPHDRLYDYVRDLAATLRDRELEKAYKNLKKASQTARYLEGIRTNSRIHYGRHNRTGVDTSFANLQIIKQRLQ
jgi:hypothetical protein